MKCNYRILKIAIGIVFVIFNHNIALSNNALPLQIESPTSQKALPQKTKQSNITNSTTKPVHTKTIVGVVLKNPLQRLYRKWQQGRVFARSIYDICEQFRNIHMVKFSHKRAFATYAQRRLKHNKQELCFLVEIIVLPTAIKVKYGNIIGKMYYFYTSAKVSTVVTVYDLDMQVIYKKTAVGQCEIDIDTASYNYLFSHFGQEWQAPFKKAFPFRQTYANLMLAMYEITSDRQSLWEFGNKYYRAAKIAQQTVLVAESQNKHSLSNKVGQKKAKIRNSKATKRALPSKQINHRKKRRISVQNNPQFPSVNSNVLPPMLPYIGGPNQ